MSQTVIPLQFEQYLQQKINDGYGPDMNEMIFAYIPDLDLAAPIDRATGLPDPSTWVHQQDVDQVGKVGESALAYSVVIPSSVAEFTFNAIYLHDKNETNSCGVIVHKISETKEQGMSSTKSLLQAYSGAATIAGISVDAATWQIDHQARLAGIDDDHRLSCLDSYGPIAFVDGFKVTKEAELNKYKITAGLAYIGGLRVITEDDITQTITTKPTDIYVDVYRDGSALSNHMNNVAIFTSVTNVNDYVDENGKKHYIAKLATIDSSGNVSEQRSQQMGELERTDNAATNADIDNKSSENKHLKLPQFWKAISDKIEDLKNNTFLGLNAKAADSDKLDGHSANYFARAEQVKTSVPLNAVFTDTQRSISDSVTSSSTSVAASSKAVKQAFDVANEALKDTERSLTANGYVKLSNGLIMQWGSFNSTEDSNELVEFAIPFPSKVFSVSGGGSAKGGSSILDDTDAQEWLSWSARKLSNTGFYANRSDSVDGTDVYFTYLAIGI